MPKPAYTKSDLIKLISVLGDNMFFTMYNDLNAFIRTIWNDLGPLDQEDMARLKELVKNTYRKSLDINFCEDMSSLMCDLDFEDLLHYTYLVDHINKDEDSLKALLGVLVIWRLEIGR